MNARVTFLRTERRRMPVQVAGIFTVYTNWFVRVYLDRVSGNEIEEHTRRTWKGETIRYWKSNRPDMQVDTLSQLLYYIDVFRRDRN